MSLSVLRLIITRIVVRFAIPHINLDATTAAQKDLELSESESEQARKEYLRFGTPEHLHHSTAGFQTNKCCEKKKCNNWVKGSSDRCLKGELVRFLTVMIGSPVCPAWTMR